jgi:hypothetical protein
MIYAIAASLVVIVVGGIGGWIGWLNSRRPK